MKTNNCGSNANNKESSVDDEDHSAGMVCSACLVGGILCNYELPVAIIIVRTGRTIRINQQKRSSFAFFMHPSMFSAVNYLL